MKTIKKYAVALVVMAAAIGMMGCKTQAHVHTYWEFWCCDEEYHWHQAICEHTDEVSDRDIHAWNHEEYQYDPTSKKDVRTCTVCDYVDEKDHIHNIATTWTKTATTHKETYDCCGAVKIAEASHSWDYEEYKYNSESGKDIRTCTVCEYVDENDHVHTEYSYAVTKTPTCVAKGSKTYTCSGCANERTEDIDALGWCETTIDAETFTKATSSSTYVYFGVFPKTIKATSITVDEAVSVTMGSNTYYKGSDGEWYAKVIANPERSSYTYSDTTKITKGNTDYFKVEPIKWKVLTTDYNGTKKALLLAEEILTANVPYYGYNSYSNTRTIGSDTRIYPNNYKYSQIRAYLNGLDYYYDTSSTETTKKTDYTDKGFLQTAFTADAQALIAQTTVDNSASSTTDKGNNITKATDYVCANTTDKIFLLSEKEVTTIAYGFAEYDSSGEGNARIRFPTDYAKANYAFQSETSGYGGSWWLRSPVYGYRYSLRFVSGSGHTNSGMISVGSADRGVVPALSISF